MFAGRVAHIRVARPARLGFAGAAGLRREPSTGFLGLGAHRSGRGSLGRAGLWRAKSAGLGCVWA